MSDITRFYGVYRGVVRETNDPFGQRRIRVSVPQTTGSEKTGWAWPLEPSHTHHEVPPVNQGVWVMYVGGDPEFPVWFGSFGSAKVDGKVPYLKALPNSEDLTGLEDQIMTLTNLDGTVDVDIVATLLAIAQKVKVIRDDLDTLL